MEPQGWLRDWAKCARNGITGHLDEWNPVFADGWKGTPIHWTNAKPDGTGWPLEQSAYWLDGAIRLGFILHDETLLKKIRARLDPVVDGINQAQDGTSFVYWKQNFQPQGFDSWAHSQMGRALVALYEGSGDPRVLAALVKVYATYHGDLRLPPSFLDVSGLCNLDAMLETYSFSGDRRILDRALSATAQPAVLDEFRVWENGKMYPGHMDIIYENVRLPAIVYPWTGDLSLLRSTLGALRTLDEKCMQPYGVASGEEYASGVGAFRKTETCDVTSLLMSSAWLYRIQGSGEWGDRMECAFFNAGAAPVARDFQSMSYYQSPNRLRSKLARTHCPRRSRTVRARRHSIQPAGLPRSPVLRRQCQSSHPELCHSHVDGDARQRVGGHAVWARHGHCQHRRRRAGEDQHDHGLPVWRDIRLNITPTKAAAFPLYLRIPGWCQRAQISVNGSAVPATPDGKGFVKLARTWNRGDSVALTLPMTPRVARGWETEVPSANRDYFRYRSDDYFKPRHLPYASVYLGPLLFALPIAEVDADTPVPDATWQFRSTPTLFTQMPASRSNASRCPPIGTGRWPRRS